VEEKYVTILVTGGTGFVGRRLIRSLVKAYGPERITCLVYERADNELERSGRAILDSLGIKMIPVDLVSGRGLQNVPKAPDFIFHLASNTDTGSRDHSINDVGARNLYEAIGPLGAGSHFIFTSTISVSDHRRDPMAPADESSQLEVPRSEYGRKKLITEAYLKEHCARDHFSLSIVRLCAIYAEGTREGGLYDQLIRLAQRRSLLSRLDYPGLMSLTHAEDIADILVSLYKSKPAPGQHELLIPVGEVLTIHEMSEAIYRAQGEGFRPVKLPKLFWAFTRAASRLIYFLEPVIPHQFYNKIWQLTLLVNNGYFNRSKRMQERLPGFHFKRFSDSVGKMIAATGRS